VRNRLRSTFTGVGIAITVGVSAWLWLGGLDGLLTPTEKVNVVRQILIPQKQVELHLIAKAPGGDYIVAGTRKTDDYHAWAGRVNSRGEMRWEFTDEATESPQARTAGGDVFDEGVINSAVTLPDKSTLLCGTRPVAKHIIAFVVHLDSQGKVIDQRDVNPGKEGILLFGIHCVQWGDGAALFAPLARQTIGLGWLLKLDSHANPVWERFNEHFEARDGLETSDHHLVLLTNNLVLLDDAGNVVAHHDILDPVNPWLVHSLTTSSTIRLAINTSPANTKFIDFDQTLHILSKTNRRGMIIQA
jgi:hypothetical protein